MKGDLAHNLGRVFMSVSEAHINRGIILNSNRQAKSLEYKPIDDRKYIPKQFQEVAESMESQFAEAMLKQMNQTVDETAGEDTGMEFYKSLQTSERAKMMSKQNNLGLQNIILDQIYPKRLRNEMALKQYEAQADLIHHNLPSYKLHRNRDTIELGKNESPHVASDAINKAEPHSEGDKP
jgi:Rod binding domain-containing protein